MAKPIYDCWGCGKKVKKVHYFCSKCWNLLPWSFQEDIFNGWELKSWLANQVSTDMIDALTAAVEFLRDHVRTSKPPNPE